jgi:1-deoxy-D-xylulose-5-phosphate synthase
VPNITIAAPRNELVLRNMMYTALQANHPTAIRYPRGIGEGVEWQGAEFTQLTEGKGEMLRNGSDIAVIAVGTMANVAMRAAERSKRSVAVYDIRYVKPLDKEMILKIGNKFTKIVTIEDGIIRGGVGETISALLSTEGLHPTIKHLGINDRFVEQGTPAQLYSECGYDEAALLSLLEKL